ncbi:hypothetical protein A3K63_01265 [Candidatus Micrarchaeota archaeon RBG_16_49_10]|nr:MAG: hypothetical protein A3K63_01265 [Candidatus Micrarchaeota archaeon RBG_16_49_10]
MSDCVFCKLVKGELDSAKIWEDEEFLAVLDIFPNTKGMTVVITKDHYDSYVFDMPDDVYQRLMLATKKVSKILEKGLPVKRVAMVMEGMFSNHAHIKLYPLHGWTEKHIGTIHPGRIFFDKYEGYVTTFLGPPADLSELKKLSEEIRKTF